MQTDPQMEQLKDSIRLDKTETDNELLRRIQRQIVKKIALQIGLSVLGVIVAKLFERWIDSKYPDED